MRIWTPQDVERETLASYSPQDWLRDNPLLDAWNKAIVLDGKHYEAWREKHIGPIEQGRRLHYRTRLQRGQITALIEYEQKLAQWRRGHDFEIPKAPE